jgi:hypothetical protein
VAAPAAAPAADPETALGESIANAEARVTSGTVPSPEDMLAQLNLPPVRSFDEIRRHYEQRPEWYTWAGHRELEADFRTELQQNEELRRTREQYLTTIGVKQRGLQAMMANRDVWGQIPNLYKASLFAEAYGMPPPPFAASWARQQPMVRNADGKDWQNAIDPATGLPPVPGQNYAITRDLLTNTYLANREQMPLITVPTLGGLKRVSAYTQGPIAEAVPSQYNRVVTMPLATGEMGAGLAGNLLAGGALRPMPGSFARGVLGTTRTEWRSVRHWDPDTGQITQTFFPVQAGTTPTLPGQLRATPLWSPPESAPAAAPPAPPAPPGVPGAPLAPPPARAPGPSRPQARMPGSISFIAPPTGQLEAMREQAPGVIDLANQVLRDLQNESFLGPVRSRWKDFWQHKVGAKDPDFAGLRLDAGLLTTLLAKMHVGLRANQDLRNEFDSMVGVGYNDPDNMIEALSHIRRYSQQVLRLGPPSFASGGTEPPPPEQPKVIPGAPGTIHVQLSKNMIVPDPKTGRHITIPAGTLMTIPEANFDPDKHIRIK